MRLSAGASLVPSVRPRSMTRGEALASSTTVAATSAGMTTRVLPKSKRTVKTLLALGC
jgi:hypothetical protein